MYQLKMEPVPTCSSATLLLKLPASAAARENINLTKQANKLELHHSVKIQKSPQLGSAELNHKLLSSFGTNFQNQELTLKTRTDYTPISNPKILHHITNEAKSLKTCKGQT